MIRTADISSDQLCRWTLGRRWGDGPTALWLMCNPSTADALIDDPTVKRVIHHSKRLDCGAATVVNLWAYRSPYPKDLWAALSAGRYTQHMSELNMAHVTVQAASAGVVVAAFGAEPWRRYQSHVDRVLGVIRSVSGAPILCLGQTDDGAPLHPLARGKHAVRNDCSIVGWP